MTMDKEIRSDAKLKNLPPEVLEELWRYRYPEEDGQKLTFVEILAELQSKFGVASSLAALSEFYAWLRLKRRIEAAAQRASQVRLELAKDASITPEDLERMGQTVFTAETIEDGDIKNYVALCSLRLKSRMLDQDERRLSILESKAKRLDEVDEALAKIRANKDLAPDAQRQALIDKMDEFFGLKKTN